MYFTPRETADEIDGIFSTLFFERLHLPAATGTPAQIVSQLDAQMAELDEKLEDAPAAPEATQAPAPTQAPEATQAPAAGETGAEAGGIGFILAAVAVAAVLAAVVLLLVRRRKGE